jgi:DNA-binding NarL/FixJ family response regulator
MRLLCIGRHPYLSGHISRYFEALDLDVTTVVGLDEALRLVSSTSPDVALCDYDLLAASPIGAWRDHTIAGQIPLLAVSLTHRPEEMTLADGVVAGSLYLPLLTEADALAALRLAASRGGVAPPPGATYQSQGVRVTVPVGSGDGPNAR